MPHYPPEALASEGVRGEGISSEDLGNRVSAANTLDKQKSLYQYINISMIQCIILSIDVCH